MQVALIEFTGKGSKDETWRAADVMIWTKHTRIEMGPGSLEAIAAWSEEKKLMVRSMSEGAVGKSDMCVRVPKPKTIAERAYSTCFLPPNHCSTRTTCRVNMPIKGSEGYTQIRTIQMYRTV